MPISAKIIDIKSGIDIVKLELEDEYFIWDNPIIEQSQEYENGQSVVSASFDEKYAGLSVHSSDTILKGILNLIID